MNLLFMVLKYLNQLVITGIRGKRLKKILRKLEI